MMSKPNQFIQPTDSLARDNVEYEYRCAEYEYRGAEYEELADLGVTGTEHPSRR
ncbi:MAG: hypothetical protein U0795_20430 [Pirellulales bacterium]